MSTPALRTVAECVARADESYDVGLHLASEQMEWATVPFFYSAYHSVKAALIADPIFEDLSRLLSKDNRLTVQDRWVKMHQGRAGDQERKLGLNDIVKYLYPDIAFEYRQLHSLSVEVRYGRGLTVATVDQAKSYADTIRAAYADGEIVA